MTTASTIWADPPGGKAPRAWQRAATDPVLQALRAGQRPLVQAVMGAGKSWFIGALVRYFLSRIEGRNDLRIVVATSTQKLVKDLATTIGAWVGLRNVGRFYGRAKQLARPVIVTCYPSAATLAQRLQVAGLRVFLLLDDEAHKTEAAEWKAGLDALGAILELGLTATPYRSTAGETLSRFDASAFSYGLQDALNDGVLVPAVWVTPPRSGMDTNDWIVETIRERCLALGPGVVDAYDIEDATSFAAVLSEAQIRAAAIHSGLAVDQQERLLRRLQDGDLAALVHVDLLSEGVDLPWLRWLACRRKSQARVRHAQYVGRGLRSMQQPDRWGEKTHCLVVDAHSLSESLSLSGSAELGEAMAGLEKKRPEPKPTPVFDLPEFDGQDREIPPTEAASALGTWASGLLANLIAGRVVVERSGLFDDPVWRARPITDGQIRALGNLRRHRGSFNEPHKSRLEQMTQEPGVRLLSRGVAQDLIDMLRACRRMSADSRQKGRGGTWKVPQRIEIPDLVLTDDGRAA